MPDAQRLDLRLPARPESIPDLRREVVAYVDGHGCDDPYSVGLAVTEAAANAAVHAYRRGDGGDVRVVVCVHPGEIEVVVRDWGAGLRPRPDSPGLGLGLPMIASLAAEFRVEAPQGEGTLVRMRFARSQARRAA